MFFFIRYVYVGFYPDGRLGGSTELIPKAVVTSAVEIWVSSLFAMTNVSLDVNWFLGCSDNQFQPLSYGKLLFSTMLLFHT